MGEVHVVDDDDGIRRSLSFLLAAAGMRVRTYDGAAAFLVQAPTLPPGCLITDVRMPDMDGIALVHRLSTSAPALPVIVITGHGDIPLAVEAMKAGAVDFLEKPFDDAILLRAVDAALNPDLRAAQQHALRRRYEAMMEELAPLERQVLASLVSGKTNRAIATELGIRPRTVEVHRARLMMKTGAESLSDLVKMSLAQSD